MCNGDRAATVHAEASRRWICPCGALPVVGVTPPLRRPPSPTAEDHPRMVRPETLRSYLRHPRSSSFLSPSIFPHFPIRALLISVILFRLGSPPFTTPYPFLPPSLIRLALFLLILRRLYFPFRIFLPVPVDHLSAKPSFSRLCLSNPFIYLL